MLDGLLAFAERRIGSGTWSLLVVGDVLPSPSQTVMFRLLGEGGTPWGSAYFDRAEEPGRFVVMVERYGDYDHGELDFAAVEAALVRAVALAEQTEGHDHNAHETALAYVRAWSPLPPPPPLAAPAARQSLGDELHRIRGAGLANGGDA